MQEKKPHISQAGEVVIWKETSGLIIKARLGERREHIPYTYCTRCESEFYRPWYEHYIGQFPIDYVPERFVRLTPKEANKLPVQSGVHGLEFNLMLNGSMAQWLRQLMPVLMDQRDLIAKIRSRSL